MDIVGHREGLQKISRPLLCPPELIEFKEYDSPGENGEEKKDKQYYLSNYPCREDQFEDF